MPRALPNPEPSRYPLTYETDALGRPYLRQGSPVQTRCLGCGYHEDKQYERLRRIERECRFPERFKRWTEDEHHKQRTLLTWDEQTTHWAHMDAWDHCFDGEWTLAETQAHIASLDPEPSVPEMLRRLASSARQQRYWQRPKAAPMPPAPPSDFLNPIDDPIEGEWAEVDDAQPVAAKQLREGAAA